MYSDLSMRDLIEVLVYCHHHDGSSAAPVQKETESV